MTPLPGFDRDGVIVVRVAGKQQPWQRRGGSMGGWLYIRSVLHHPIVYSLPAAVYWSFTLLPPPNTPPKKQKQTLFQNGQPPTWIHRS